MDGLKAFFDMGGYAGYIWPCYGLTMVVLVGLLVHSLREARDEARALERLRGVEESKGEA